MEINKTIYMTYKRNIPQFVFDRWTSLNKDYSTDFSLDNECVDFMKEHFNEYVGNLFNIIKNGQYKADLWRLCKLYIHGGVYADVDLVPYINIDTLDKDVTFYSCMSIVSKTIFQAFMVNFKPKSRLILSFLVSFLINNAHINRSPTEDMYNCICYNVGKQELSAEEKYIFNQVKIPVIIGSSQTSSKEISLHYFPSEIPYSIELIGEPINGESFKFEIVGTVLKIENLSKTGWSNNYSVDIIINSQECVYLFKENHGPNRNWVTSYVTNNGTKILDSRDLAYHINHGW